MEIYERGPDRKTLQLCAQVERVLSLALAGCGDETLQEVMIESVGPGPDDARLTVTIALPPGPGARGPRQVLEALTRARGVLRTEIAAAIHRQRVPELAFRFTVPGMKPEPPRHAEGTNHGGTEDTERE
jgi:ribosome-binding factor A